MRDERLCGPACGSRGLGLGAVGKKHVFIDREAGEIIRLVASVCLFVCDYVRALLFEPLDLRP